jgi:hypothetical protein
MEHTLPCQPDIKYSNGTTEGYTMSYSRRDIGRRTAKREIPSYSQKKKVGLGTMPKCPHSLGVFYRMTTGLP